MSTADIDKTLTLLSLKNKCFLVLRHYLLLSTPKSRHHLKFVKDILNCLQLKYSRKPEFDHIERFKENMSDVEFSIIIIEKKFDNINDELCRCTNVDLLKDLILFLKTE
jgi:hypothetical protein